MNKVNITIDGINLYVPENYTILEAAKEVNINIPTLCYLKDVNEIGLTTSMTPTVWMFLHVLTHLLHRMHLLGSLQRMPCCRAP